jgi:hypothetical protein
MFLMGVCGGYYGADSQAVLLRRGLFFNGKI